MAEGVDAVVEGKTPIGSMVVRSEWRVCARRLKEVVGIESNPFTKNIVRKNIEKSHYGFHKYATPSPLFAVSVVFAPTCSRRLVIPQALSF
ncbi:hypothetical protein F4801DRAFT_203540 [Xylaria longipes]|nr:hypothetical protein F4801DRAFT_203540 [Xylaria longipes]